MSAVRRPDGLIATLRDLQKRIRKIEAFIHMVTIQGGYITITAPPTAAGVDPVARVRLGLLPSVSQYGIELLNTSGTVTFRRTSRTPTDNVG